MSGVLTITAQGREFTVYPQTEPDQVIYIIHEGNNEIGSIGLNENAAWEATNDMDEDLVREIGDIIEKKDL